MLRNVLVVDMDKNQEVISDLSLVPAAVENHMGVDHAQMFQRSAATVATLDFLHQNGSSLDFRFHQRFFIQWRGLVAEGTKLSWNCFVGDYRVRG